MDEWAQRRKTDPKFKKCYKDAFKNIPPQGFFLVKPFNIKVAGEKVNNNNKQAPQNRNKRTNERGSMRRQFNPSFQNFGNRQNFGNMGMRMPNHQQARI
jgi:hypothetical protein